LKPNKTQKNLCYSITASFDEQRLLLSKSGECLKDTIIKQASSSSTKPILSFPA